MMRKPTMSGLSLIELMVVLVIIGVLSSLAYPSYLQHLARRDRLDAINLLHEAQLFMERYHAINARYSVDSNGLTPPTLPARLQSTASQTSNSYSLSVQAGLSSYTLTVTPKITQGQWCDQLSLKLSHTGAKTALAADGSTLDAAAVAACWR